MTDDISLDTLTPALKNAYTQCYLNIEAGYDCFYQLPETFKKVYQAYIIGFKKNINSLAVFPCDPISGIERNCMVGDNLDISFTSYLNDNHQKIKHLSITNKYHQFNGHFDNKTALLTFVKTTLDKLHETDALNSLQIIDDIVQQNLKYWQTIFDIAQYPSAQNLDILSQYHTQEELFIVLSSLDNPTLADFLPHQIFKDIFIPNITRHLEFIGQTTMDKEIGLFHQDRIEIISNILNTHGQKLLKHSHLLDLHHNLQDNLNNPCYPKTKVKI